MWQTEPDDVCSPGDGVDVRVRAIELHIWTRS